MAWRSEELESGFSREGNRSQGETRPVRIA